MRSKKYLAIALSCLLLWESPIVTQSALSAASMARPAVSQGWDSKENPPAASAGPCSQEGGTGSAGSRLQAGEADAVGSPLQEEGSGPAGSCPQEGESGSTGSRLQEGVSDSISGISPGEEGSSVSQEGQGTEDPQWVSISQDSCTLTVGGRLQLEAEAEYPSEFTWSSSQEGVVSVTEDGTITAQGLGTAIITVTAAAATEDGFYRGAAFCEVTVENSISLNPSSLSVYVGEAGKITAVLLAEEPITWSSSQPEILKVDENGGLEPQKAGHATVTAITESGVSASCRVTVKQPSLKLKSAATAYLKGALQLEATAKPQGTVKWKSSNPKVAKVGADGKVTPLKKGTVTITATCNGISKKCKVTVKDPSLKLKTSKATLYEGSVYPLEITAKPAAQLKWKSSNAKVASVSPEGEIVTKKAGSATLTASLLGKKATCKVQVLPDKHKLNRTAVPVMEGQSSIVQLLNLSGSESVYFQLLDDSWEFASLSYSGNACEIVGKKAGTATLQAVYTAYIDGQAVTGTKNCTIKVVDSGIAQQQIALAVNAKKTMKLKNVGKSGLSVAGIAWESTNPKVAAIDGKGVVTGKAAGTAKIAATVTYSDKSTGKFLTTIKISNPKLKASSTVMTVGKSKKLKLAGTNPYSKVKWSINKKSLAAIQQDGTVVSGYRTGKATITLSVDGKTIKHKLAITDPKLKSSYKALTVGKAAQISVKGASSKKNITYTSKNKAVATVSKSGRVKAKSYGNADILIKVDGISLTFKVSVAPQRALSACKSGHQIMYSSSYSQARRMEQGFYDCSSLVFRAYGRDAGLLGGTPSYAPTAASMAYYLERTGKAVSFKGVDSSKLLPGDLIFYGDPSNRNGRYKNIYHVSMYYGDGYRLEKPLRYYYPDSNIVLVARPVR